MFANTVSSSVARPDIWTDVWIDFRIFGRVAGRILASESKHEETLAIDTFFSDRADSRFCGGRLLKNVSIAT